jgi:radical SAM superfamily enzyme YgiQ (UPF0313 family)
MQITFVKFSIFGSSYNVSFKPLIFPTIRALTPNDVHIEFVDEHVDHLPEHVNAGIIALSVETMTARKARAFALKHKGADNIIICGGFHPSAVPEECLEYADSVVIGDAEDTWPRFLADVRAGSVQKVYRSSLSMAPVKPVPHLSYFSGKQYGFIGLAQFSRGCRFNCDFCSVKAMYPGPVRTKNVADFVEEVRAMPETLIFLADDTLFVDHETTLHLLESLKPLGKVWHCQISMDVAYDERLLHAMKEAGVAIVMIGFEATRAETLKQMNKGANLRVADYAEAIHNIYRHGLMIAAGFISGYDDDTTSTIWQHFDFCMKHHFTKAFFTMLQPMPGTRLYDRLRSEGRMAPDKWWLDAAYKYGDCVFVPKKMSRAALERDFYAAWKRYYRLINIWKRFIANSRYLTFKRSLMFFGEAILQKKNLSLDASR